jgi:hypothetical protein
MTKDNTEDKVSYAGNGTAGIQNTTAPTGFFFQMPRQEPVAHQVIAGALFDFMGWLTSRNQRLTLSSTDEASPAVAAITEFAKMRGLSLDDARVQDWQDNTTPPAQPAPYVASPRVQEPPPECQTEAEKRAYAFGWWKALEANRAAPVQEPVACVIDGDLYFHHEIDWEDLAYQGHGVELLYTTPPAAQRQWVGLTDEEITALKRNGERYISSQDFARAIEAKLRSKNNG